jgi:hypothetical protein
MSEGQQNVVELLQVLTQSKVLVNYKHPELSYLNTHRNMELDIYIPSLQLAFEYQGNRHSF